MEEKGLFERMACSAREQFADFDERGLYKGCDYLAIWHYRSGNWFGSGDFPEAHKTKSVAKGVCANQVRRESGRCEGYVAERRGGRVYVYSIGDWQPAASIAQSPTYVTDPHCWRQPLASVRCDGQADWEVTAQSSGPRSRLSPLAQRAA